MNMKHKRVMVTGLATILFTFFSIKVFAGTKATIAILNQFHFDINDPVSNTMRKIAWGMVKGLHWLVKGLEDVVYNINNALGGFFTSEQIQALQSKIILIALALIVLLILFIGIMNMIKPQQVTTIISNLIIGVVVAIAIPTLLSEAYNFSTQAIAYINSDANGSLQKMSDRILIDNITDVTRYETEGFKSTTLKYKNNFLLSGNPDKISEIDATELVDPENMKKPEVWSNKIVEKNGKQELKELSSGKIGFVDAPILSGYYYRWKFDWLNIFSTLLVTGTALILSSIKIARLLYELAIHQVMTQIVALLDVMTAQRLKKCIQMLVATFVTLIAVFFMLQVFIIGMTYISNVTNPILRLILMVALAWSVIDGPNLFEQILGVDAGINGALKTVYGLKAAGGIMTGAMAVMGGRGALEAIKAQGIIGSAKSVVSKTGGVMGTLGGVAAGAVAGARENSQRVSDIKSGFAGQTAEKASTIKSTPDISSAANTEMNVKTSSSPSSPLTSGLASFMDKSESPTTTTAHVRDINPEKSIPIAKTPSGISQNSFVPPEASGVSETPAAPEPTITSAVAVPPHATTNKKKDELPGTIGAYIGSAISARVKQSTPVTSARRAYALTKGSTQQRGNKIVATEEKAQRIMSEGEGIPHREAIKQAKREMREEKKDAGEGIPWVHQEQDAERSQQLHKESENKK